MKKKIAVYANGWSIDALMDILGGMESYAAENDSDIFVYLSFATYSEHINISRGELNLYDLGNMEDYDGIVVLSTMLNSNETAVELCRKAKAKNIPVVSLGMEIEEIPAVCIANEVGMRDLVTHIVEEHGVKNVMFIGGTPDHVDSIARLRVTEEVLKEHGLELKPEDIKYGQWGNDGPRSIVRQLHESGEPMPDAIVVANDVMALAAHIALVELGYKVPDDVILTGFDNSAFGKCSYPAMSTVSQNYGEAGKAACDILGRLISGEEVPAKTMVPSRFICAESCGCHNEGYYEEFRDIYCRDAYKKHVDASLLEQTERVLRLRISMIPDYEALKRMMRTHYLDNHRFEGSEFHMVLSADYFGNIMAEESEIYSDGMHGEMDAVVSIRDNELLPEITLPEGELIPHYVKKKGEQHVYFLMALHYFQYNYGYVVMTDRPYVVVEDMLYPYMEKLMQSLKLLRINLRLDTLNRDLTRIYDKDPMTGLYNRFAYENKAKPLFEESMVKKMPMTVMFVDINYMKRINDQYGHIHGDNAIKAVSDSIMQNMKEGWIPVRFGGDEFLVIAPECGEKEAEKLQRVILDSLEKKNNDGTRPYRISVSCAHVVTNPFGRETLQDYVKEADGQMYEIKQQVHARDGMPYR
ncbi:MAG: GGDEF domain-containing protein [Lachnospiraceae bacterium]|nr:GGDEF domain-containing protein [Lachnospiraceae bacterium]